MQYYILFNNNVIGPMAAHQILSYNPNPNTQVSTNGVDFQPLYAFPELMGMVQNQQPKSSDDSKRIAFGILALLIGGLGIQYFITGKTTAGILTIVLSLVTCGIWTIITFIQGIIVLCMSDEDFEQKFVNTPKTFPLF